MTSLLSSPAPAVSHTSDEVRRRELAAFLRSRRERVTPDQVGLPPGGRRRTPGLRREEVAQLAGVGVTWYTWLEQGRDINASEQVLDAVSTTLRLDPIERSHLFTLAGLPEAAEVRDCRAVPSPVHLMLAQLNPYPACVLNSRTDILAFNRSYDLMVGGISELPFEQRNSLQRCFLDQRSRACVLDWEESAMRMVAQFRAAMAEHVAEPSWKCLVKKLRQESAEFDRMWQQHEVSGVENQTKRYLHPDVGLLRLDYTHLWLGRRAGTRLVSYTPADSQTLARLREMVRVPDSAGAPLVASV
ncbi:MAG TPA: helix-turn-helix transcriptional regulator [Pseudonocardiaceae bacterium]|jgi:transcriptional regulator with XRE-family HTH domain|nr:helix-turn-helix transcriptional regulator [Pseudonocardiaceae bacterium]